MVACRKIRNIVFLFHLFWISFLRAEEDFTFFETKIRPILVEHCYKCHSADAEKVKGGLLLDSREGVLKGGDSGPAIVSGKPEESLLIKAVQQFDKDLQMPPPKSGRKLSEEQINDLVMWIKLGAPDPRTGKSAVVAKKPTYDFEAARKLWAFQKPEDPSVPKIQNTKWPKSPIDNFILAKLEEKNLRPATAADKRTLIRRATFDLIGLPPTPAEIDAFLKDKSPNAFAKVVERLLASPHYGERWGRHWLDVVRYADSADARVTGGPEDFAEAWRYRDWVVNSFNRDLPYDQFITQQLAGDLLPPPEPDGIDTNAIIATGMYAIGNWGNGDADKDKILTDIADDAVDVTGRAFLGLTLACARCHDHKFDPIPTEDYYSLAGIFFSSHIIPKLSPKGSGETMLRIPLISKAEVERRKQREVRMLELEKKIEQAQDEQIAELAKKVLPKTENYLTAVWQLRQDKEISLALVAADRELDEVVLKRWLDFLDAGSVGLFSQPVENLLNNRGLHAWRNAAGADTPSVVANATDLEASFLTIKLPAHRLAIHPSPKDGVAAGWKSPIRGEVEIRGRVVDVDPNCGDGIDWELVKISRGSAQSLAKGSIPSGGKEEFIGKTSALSCEVQPGELLQVNVYPKGGYECDTTLVEFEIAETSGQKRVWDINRDVVPDFLASNPHSDSFGNADVWYFRDLAEKEMSAPEGTGFAQWTVLARSDGSKSSDVAEVVIRIQRELLEGAAKSRIYESFSVPRGAFWTSLRNEQKIFAPDKWKKLADFKAELATLRNNPPPPVEMANGLQEGGVPESPHAGVHDVKIHVRGKYDRLGEVAPRRFLRLLAGDERKPVTGGSGRLQLAAWLISPENPLTARVMVNRIWQHHFGEGIVRTPNNFGKLGAPPTHPELLDYLSHRFMESGWSIKAMHRAIMLSATYQQSATGDAATMKADPENKLFGRMNRQRLDAESLRDGLLAAAGRLDEKLGGSSIRDLNNNRRTLYLMMIRSDRSNYRMLFDAADPNSIVEQRVVSTVAPQALFLMNHPFVLAQTTALAEQVAALKVKSDEKRIEWLYRNLFGRAPTSQEIKIGRESLTKARQALNQNEKLVWQEYCQVLLCANEFVYVD